MKNPRNQDAGIPLNHSKGSTEGKIFQLQVALPVHVAYAVEKYGKKLLAGVAWCATPSAMPSQRAKTKEHISFYISGHLYQQALKLAALRGETMTEFCTVLIIKAVENIELTDEDLDQIKARRAARLAKSPKGKTRKPLDS